MGAVWLEKITNDQPVWETDTTRAAGAVFLLQTRFFVLPIPRLLPLCDNVTGNPAVTML